MCINGKLLFHIKDTGGNEEEEEEEEDEEEGHHLPRPPVQEVRPGDHLQKVDWCGPFIFKIVRSVTSSL